MAGSNSRSVKPPLPLVDSDTKTKTGTLTSRDRQRIETRNKVFQAAIDEFNRVGVANAQIEKITTAAGVSVGTYYRYFPTKDSIIFELMQQYMNLASENLSNLQSSEKQVESTLKETLLATIDSLFDFLEQDDSPLIREMFALMVKQQPPEDFDWTAHPFLETIIKKFQMAIDNGESDYDATRLTRIFFTSIFGFITSMNPIRSRTEANEFVSIFLRGIQSQ